VAAGGRTVGGGRGGGDKCIGSDTLGRHCSIKRYLGRLHLFSVPLRDFLQIEINFLSELVVFYFCLCSVPEKEIACTAVKSNIYTYRYSEGVRESPKA